MPSLTNLFHGIHHEFINVPIVLHGVLILKVTAKGEHDVVCSIVAGLKEDVFDESVHSLIHIVAHQVRIILEYHVHKYAHIKNEISFRIFKA